MEDHAGQPGISIGPTETSELLMSPTAAVPNARASRRARGGLDHERIVRALEPAAHREELLHPAGEAAGRRHAAAQPRQLEVDMGVHQARHQGHGAEIAKRPPGPCLGTVAGAEGGNPAVAHGDPAVPNRRALHGHHPGGAETHHATGDGGGCDRWRLPAALRAG